MSDDCVVVVLVCGWLLCAVMLGWGCVVVHVCDQLCVVFACDCMGTAAVSSGACMWLAIAYRCGGAYM